MNDTLDTPNYTDYELDLEANFNTAMKMSGGNYDYSALMNFLRSNKMVEKQISVLKLTEIKSKKDAEILVSNLIGQDGKIREAVAFKVNELAKNPEFTEFFADNKIFAILRQGIMDINGNVCRQIVDLVGSIEGFDEYLCETLPERISVILEEIEKIDQISKQYVISKRNFQLYWCLEALCSVVDKIDIENIKEILFKAGAFQDYTIREKTAKILAKIDNAEFAELMEKLKNDENYYVQRCFGKK